MVPCDERRRPATVTRKLIRRVTTMSGKPSSWLGLTSSAMTRITDVRAGYVVSRGSVAATSGAIAQSTRLGISLIAPIHLRLDSLATGELRGASCPFRMDGSEQHGTQDFRGVDDVHCQRLPTGHRAHAARVRGPSAAGLVANLWGTMSTHGQGWEATAPIDVPAPTIPQQPPWFSRPRGDAGPRLRAIPHRDGRRPRPAGTPGAGTATASHRAVRCRDLFAVLAERRMTVSWALTLTVVVTMLGLSQSLRGNSARAGAPGWQPRPPAEAECDRCAPVPWSER